MKRLLFKEKGRIFSSIPGNWAVKTSLLKQEHRHNLLKVQSLRHHAAGRGLPLPHAPRQALAELAEISNSALFRILRPAPRPDGRDMLPGAPLQRGQQRKLVRLLVTTLGSGHRAWRRVAVPAAARRVAVRARGGPSAAACRLAALGAVAGKLAAVAGRLAKARRAPGGARTLAASRGRSLRTLVRFC